MAAIEMGGGRRGDAGLLPAVFGVVAMMVGGIAAGLAVFAAAFLLTDMAAMPAAIGGAVGYFAMAHYLVHEWRQVKPMRLLTVNFLVLWALLFAGALALSALTALAGSAGGLPAAAILIGPPVLAGLLTALPALAVGGHSPQN